MQDLGNKPLNYNMATVANGVSVFTGGETEDVSVWIRDLLTIARVTELSQEDTFRLMIIKLKDTALSWASELLEAKQWNVTLEEFIALLKKRFSGPSKTEFTLSNFINAEQPTLKEEILRLLRNGGLLFEKKLMSLETIIRILISKCPDKIQGTLFVESGKA